jgi:hypothetical protein
LGTVRPVLVGRHSGREQVEDVNAGRNGSVAGGARGRRSALGPNLIAARAPLLPSDSRRGRRSYREMNPSEIQPMQPSTV